jgi:hypothetical protein
LLFSSFAPVGAGLVYPGGAPPDPPPAFLSFLVPEFTWMISRLDLAMRALNLQTFWRQFRFLGEKIICQRVSYFGVSEKLFAVFALQSPSSHRPDTILKTTDGT